MFKSPKEGSISDENPTKEIINYLREKDQKIEQLIEEKAVLKFKYEQMKNNQQK